MKEDSGVFLRCVPNLLCNGALTSDSFSERMISNANLLVDPHRLKFGDEMIDKLVVLRMNKKFMDRLRITKAHATMNFDNADSTSRNML